jgi:integrase/recombinase XerD
MTDTPEEKYESIQQTIWGDEDTFEVDGYVDTGKLTQTEAERIQELCDAFDGEKLDRQHHTEKKQAFEPDKRKDKSYSTLWGWMYRLSRMGRDLKNAEFTDATLVDAEAAELNDLMERGYYKADVPNCNGMTKGTIRTYQFALRIFYRYHSDLGVNPEHIAIYTEDDDSSVDPDDMLTKEEIERLKDAADHPRDKMILMLLLYTGMRSNALRTLRVKDIDLSDGTYRFNPNVDHGLKGADDRNGNRPMLLATGAVRQWLNNYHPGRSRDDFEECYLVTGKPNYGKIDPKSAVGNNCLRYVLGNLKEETGIEKPLNPHSLRHNFVTICKRDYDMDNDTIKWLIGHTKDSRVMETTYSHLSDMDFRQKAEQKAGLIDETDHSTLTPKQCSCGEKVAPSAKACPNCGMMFTPDARSVQEQVESDVKGSLSEAGKAGDIQAIEDIDDVDDLLDHPEIKAALLDKLQE